MSKMLEESRVYRPFLFPWAVDISVEHERMHWHESEIPLGEDVGDWKMGKLTETEQEFITQILRMFTQADVNVGTYYNNILIPRFKNNELRMMMNSFTAREGTHQRAYALLNDTLGLPEGDYAAFLEYAEMKDKHEFMLAADPQTRSGLGLAIAKGVFNEGVSLFASFVMLLHFQQRGLMKGMCKIVEWSIKDETKHVEGLSTLFRAYCQAHPHIVTDRFKHTIYDMARDVVRLEDAFIDLAYKTGQIEGLTATDVKTYIRYIADRRLVQLGLKPNFMVENNPLPWLDWIVSSTRHTNFFENKVAEYEVAGLQGEWKYPSVRNQFRIYTMSGCGYCTRAKQLMVLHGLKFEEVDLSDTDKRNRFLNGRMFLEAATRTMPKVYKVDPDKGELLIGGYTELESFLGENL
jgi:glutaredoxin 3